MKGRNRRTRAASLGLGLALAAALAAPAAPGAAQESTPRAAPEIAPEIAPEVTLEIAPKVAPETASETGPEPSRNLGPTRPAAAAVQRLDFATALADLAAAIEADPTAPEPRLARAELHMKMQRPALALADLGAVLATDPAHLEALRARLDIWTARRAWTRARADLDAALAAEPGNAAVLALRARLNESAGMTDAALADYEAALAAAPEDEALARARDALLASRATPAAARVVFGPEAVMSDDFVVVEGAVTAPDTLHIVHAATALSEELAAFDPTLVDRAIDSGALRVVHLFTYTGEEASIWGNLALICAGPKGFAAARAALSDTDGRAALDAAGAGDFAPLERLLNAAYKVAGTRQDLVRSCALDRRRATRYLADWQSHRDAGAWRGVNLLDVWPAWVLNGRPMVPDELADVLARAVPEPAAPPPHDDGARAGATSMTGVGSGQEIRSQAPPAAADETTAARALATGTPGRDTAPAPARPTLSVADGQAGADVPAPPAGDGKSALDPAVAPEPGTAAPGDGPGSFPGTAPGDASKPATGNPPREAAPRAAVRFPNRPAPVAGARVPTDLRGVYAPSLAACLRYLDGIEDPSRIDAVLPEMNPPGEPALGTILVTSRRVYLFNPLDTECAIAASDGDPANWQGTFACSSPSAPERVPVLRLAAADADGSTPRLVATFGAEAAVTQRQCRSLGQLGKAFASLWTREGTACRVAVPVENGRFTFSVDAGGDLILRMAPAAIPALAGRVLPQVAVDAEPLGDAPGRWDGTGWQISLGPFAAAAERLGWGMFLDIRTTGDLFEARLPLFGSSAAMARLAECAPTGN